MGATLEGAGSALGSSGSAIIGADVGAGAGVGAGETGEVADAGGAAPLLHEGAERD